MAWMSVELENFSDQKDAAVNIDTIVSIRPRSTGSTLRFIDKSELDVRDSYEELIKVVLTAAEKKK